MKHYDLVVIGGGINGCGCAADAALRGLSVLLCERDDLASKTSSNSSKLIHGGLRYLEHYDFSLVKKALDERQRLLNLAPHLVRPLPFILAHKKQARSQWQLNLGLFIYDHLSLNNKLPNHQRIKRSDPSLYFTPLNDTLNKGYLYYDCITDDARLVIANALQAQAHGAIIRTQTTLIDAVPMEDKWHLTFESKDKSTFTVQARAVVNAAGPWVESVNLMLQHPSETRVTLVQGSHLVVPKLYDGEHAYVLQDNTGRIVFTIPHYGKTLIGTTETVFHGDPDTLQALPEEMEYLCHIVNQYFHSQIKPTDAISSFSGIRTLLSATNKTPTTLSRDFVYDFSKIPAPILTLWSGKLTTYRELASHAIDELRHVFPKLSSSTTAITPLPGATDGQMNFKTYQALFPKHYPWLDKNVAQRYLTTYGTHSSRLLKNKHSMADLGQYYGETLYQAEVEYLIEHEWATTIDDILWRRTKLGLIFNTLQYQALNNDIEAYQNHKA